MARTFLEPCDPHHYKTSPLLNVNTQLFGLLMVRVYVRSVCTCSITQRRPNVYSELFPQINLVNNIAYPRQDAFVAESIDPVALPCDSFSHEYGHIHI